MGALLLQVILLSSILCFKFSKTPQFTTGGEDVQAEKLLTDVLMYDHTTDEWTSVGDLNTARADHAMARVPAVIEDHCIFEI